jgi:aspartate/methionine/tyrosine aminotransferase
MPDAMPRLSDRVSLLRPSAVNTILAEVRALQAQGRPPVSLMRGEPDFPTPPHIVEAAVAALQRGRTSYPDNRGEWELRKAISERLEADAQLVYDPASEILVTDGATLAIHAALTALVEEDDEVLLPDPIYDAYQSPIRLAGAAARPVESAVADGRYSLPLEALEAAWTPDARVLLLNTPWNPVGTVFEREELERIGEFVLRRNLVLISDEIYEHIVYDGRRHVSPAALSPELRQRTVLINSFSKTYAMTGWRLGYIAARRELIQAMLLVLQQSSRGPATFVQDAGAAALRGPQDCVAQMLESYAQRRRQVVEALSGLPGVEITPPEGGFFAMANVSRLGQSSDALRRHLLEQHGVVVAHGAAYGARGEGTLRISFASGGENLQRGLARLRTGLQG